MTHGRQITESVFIIISVKYCLGRKDITIMTLEAPLASGTLQMLLLVSLMLCDFENAIPLATAE